MLAVTIKTDSRSVIHRMQFPAISKQYLAQILFGFLLFDDSGNSHSSPPCDLSATAIRVLWLPGFLYIRPTDKRRALN